MLKYIHNRAKEIARNITIRLFMAKKNDLKKLSAVDFDASAYDAENIINSSVIVKCTNESEIKYFRESRRHLKLRQQVLTAVRDYFRHICKHPQRQEIEKFILEDLKLDDNYKKIIHMVGIFDYHLMDILSGAYCDYDAVGLPCFHKIEAKEEFIPFIQYINCIISGQKINQYLKLGELENNNANKQLATYELSKCFGLLGLIPAVVVCKFVRGKEERIGTLMDDAGGEPPSAIVPADRKNWDKRLFLRDITNLEYFDAICYQLDHRLDNYHVIRDDEGRIAKVVAFDNDASRTFFVRSKLPKSTYAGACCIVGKGGYIKRPYMDIRLAKRILEIDKKSVCDSVGQYLSCFQLNALWKRICILKKGIKATQKMDDTFLVEDWSNVDMDKALAQRYGSTYLSLYLYDTVMLDREKAFNEMKSNRG